MSTRRRSKLVAAGIAAAGSAGLVAATLAVGAGISSAEPVSLTLNYTCPFPMIGKQPVKVVINADIPSTATVGEPTPEFKIDAVSTVNDKATQGLNMVGAKTIEGTALADSVLEAPEGNLEVKVPTTIAKTPIPASGAFDVNASGNAPSLTFSQPGKAKITVGNILLTLTPKKADGSETGLKTFESACVQDTGQNNVLREIEIKGEGGPTSTATPPPSSSTATPPPSSSTATPPPSSSTATPPPSSSTATPPPSSSTATPPPSSSTVTPPPSSSTVTPPPGGDPIKLAYDLKGSSFIKAPNGTVPIGGGINVNFDLASGKYEADLALNNTKGKFNIMGFLQAEADVAFEQVGKTTGTYDGNALKSHSEMFVKLTSVKAWGFPIGGGPTCRTKTPAIIDLTAEGFDPFSGGTLKGEYELPKLEGCGQLNDWISMFTAGPGNTITMDLVKKG